METVEVVIKINKNTFDAINELSKFVDDNHIINGYQMKGNSTVGSMITAIAKGTVLPKGQGALDMAIKALEQEPILDKIRAEIIELRSRQNVGVLECLDIIDKYKTESEE